MITKPLPGVIIDPSHPLSKGLVGYWLFNEGGGDIANDISGHGNHGRLMNMLPNTQGSKWQGSKFGGGLAFDGNNDYINCGNDSSLDITDAITVEAWVKYSSFNDANHNPIIEKNLTSTSGMLLNLFSDSSWKFYIPDGSGIYFPHISYTTTVNADQWYHVVGTYNGSKMYLYINGVERENKDRSGDLLLSASDLEIAKWTTHRSHCAIDRVKIYNRALSVEDVKQSYLDPFCNLIDISIWQRVSLAGLNIPIAHNYYERLRT